MFLIAAVNLNFHYKNHIRTCAVNFVSMLGHFRFLYKILFQFVHVLREPCDCRPVCSLM